MSSIYDPVKQDLLTSLSLLKKDETGTHPGKAAGYQFSYLAPHLIKMREIDDKLCVKMATIRSYRSTNIKII